MRIDGVLFDFGGVVVPAPFAGFTELETRHGLTPGLLRAVNARNPDTNAWAQLERASIGVDEFVPLFEAEVTELGATIDGRDVLALIQAVPVDRDRASPDVLDAVTSCRKQGLRVGLLTNNIAPLASVPGSAWIAETFDVVVESSRVGLRKPDPQIYELACAELGTRPEASVLLDDLGINLKPARALGMHTIKVVEPASAAAELEALLARCQQCGIE